MSADGKIATAWVELTDLETGNEHHGTYRSGVKNLSAQNQNCPPAVHKEEINNENIAALSTVDIYFTDLACFEYQGNMCPEKSLETEKLGLSIILEGGCHIPPKIYMILYYIISDFYY